MVGFCLLFRSFDFMGHELHSSLPQIEGSSVLGKRVPGRVKNFGVAEVDALLLWPSLLLQRQIKGDIKK